MKTIKDSECMIWTSRQERAACELAEKIEALALNEDVVILDMPVTKRKFSAVEMPQVLEKRPGEPLESESKRARTGLYTRPLARKIGSSASMPFLQQAQQTAASSPLSLNDITQQIFSLAIAPAITPCPQASAPTEPQDPAPVQPATIEDTDLVKIQNTLQGLQIDPSTPEQLMTPSSEPATSEKTESTDTTSEPASKGPKSRPTTTELMNPDREPAKTQQKTVVVDKANGTAPKQQELQTPKMMMPPPKKSATQMRTDRALEEAEATLGGLSLQPKSRNEERREYIIELINESIEKAEELKTETETEVITKKRLDRLKAKLDRIGRYIFPEGNVDPARTSRDWMKEKEISTKLFRVGRWMQGVR